MIESQGQRGWGWLVAAVIGAVAPAACVLASGHTLIWRDSAQLYAPLRPVVVQALRSLRLPTWNPWEGTGQPLFAQGLHSVIHPVALALAFVTSSTDALLVAFLATASVGAFSAARTLGNSPPAAAAAALGFSLSGFVQAMCANQVFLAGAATGPWVIAGMQAATRHRRGWILAALAACALALSGDAGALAAYPLAGVTLAFATGGRRGAFRSVAGGALGIALAAVQLLPSWMYLAQTWRGPGAGESRIWSLAPSRLIELAVPGMFVGVPSSYVAPVWVRLGGDGTSFPFASSVYVGALVLLLAVSGAKSDRRARWLLGLAALFLWLALGHHAGSQQLLRLIPVWGSLRYWEKMTGPLTLCIALAAGFGADALLRCSVLATRRGPWPAVVAGAVFLQSAPATVFALHAGNPVVLAARPPALDAPEPGPRVVSPLGFEGAVGRDGFDAIDYLQWNEGRFARPSTNVAARMDSLAAYTGLTSLRWEMVLASGPWFWTLARRFGTTHVLSPIPSNAREQSALQAATWGAKREEGPAGVLVWSLPHRPWASFAPAVRAAATREEAADVLGEELAAGRPTVVVEAPEAPPLSAGQVLSVRRGAEQVETEAESARDGLLIINDAWSPGWEASIDGRPARILPADVLVRAVPWPAGRHRLILRYWPPGLTVGLLISALAAVFLITAGLRRSAVSPACSSSPSRSALREA